MIDSAKKEALRQFITGKLAKKENQKAITDEDNIIMSGLVDSLGIMRLIAFLEEKFGVKVRDEDILPENFESIDNIARFLSSQGL